METLTLFKVFEFTHEQMRSVLVNRGSSFGIMVQDDPMALKYQRYRRLANKLRDRLLARLAAEK